ARCTASGEKPRRSRNPLRRRHRTSGGKRLNLAYCWRASSRHRACSSSSDKSSSNFRRASSGWIPFSRSSCSIRRRPLGRLPVRLRIQSSANSSSFTYPRLWHQASTSAATAGEKPRRTSLRSSSCAVRARTASRRKAAALAAATSSGTTLGIARHHHLPVAGRRRRHRQPRQACDFSHLVLDLGRQIRVLLEELLGVLPALPEAHVTVGKPRAGLGHDLVLAGHVQDDAEVGDAYAVHDVELGLINRRRQLVLADLDAGAGADEVRTMLDGIHPPALHPNGGGKLKRPPARGRLRRAEENA